MGESCFLDELEGLSEITGYFTGTVGVRVDDNRDVSFSSQNEKVKARVLFCARFVPTCRVEVKNHPCVS
jgi:hypothetical protein